MKIVDAAVRNAIRTAHDVKALPRLTAEWNMNRYHETTVTNDVANWESIENDIDMFPIESIVEPIRPSKGINKARINYGTVSDSYATPSMPRYYVASLEDKYKYWISPTASDASGNIGNVAPRVIYASRVNVNKIVVTVENSWASPTTWSIQTTNDGGASWQTASSAPTIGNDGRAILYWNGASWSSNKPADQDPTTSINGVRVVVSRLGGGIGINGQPTQARLAARNGGGIVNTSGAGSYFSLIEISARLEMDLTENLIDNSDNFDAGEANQITPVGTITSNVAGVTLWNGDNAFSASMEGLLEPNVKMNLEYLYHIGAQVYPVQQFSMYTENWRENSDSTISVELSDASKYLKETYPREAKYEKVTLAQIVYRLLDQVGFTDYNIVNHGYINDFRIPVFWVDGTETIWEVFEELSTATQSLIYFDAYGRLNVKSREHAFDPARPVDWTLRGENFGNELADIVELDKSGSFDSNVIKVRYKNTAWAEEINGHVQNTTTWSPEDTVTLRATPLLGGLDTTAEFITISPGEVVHWPYEGHVQIEGEFIEYSGKWFNYREANGTWGSVWVHDQKEYDEYNEKAGPNMRVHNHFLGRLKIVERGVWNSEISDHTPEAKGWGVKRYNWATNNSWNSNSCWQWHSGSSMVRMSSNGDLQNTEQWAVALRGVPTDLPYRKFGTRFRFNGAALHHRAGIVFYAQGNGDGYYVECRPTNTIENKNRDTEDEITLYSIHGNNYKKMKANWRAPDLIVADTWHDLEVGFDPGSHTIHIWLDGKRVMSDTIQPTNYRHAPTGKFGMFIRGQTNVDFEYFYAISEEEPWLSDNATWLNRVTGAFVGENWFRDRVYRTRQRTRWIKRKGKKKGKRKVNETYKYANFMDEFGPYVHEVREFDVKFDPAPVKSAFLYMSNDYGIVCPEFRSDSHGAYFILANASRRNEIAHGDDAMTFAAAGATVNQQLLVYGRALVIGEDEEVEVRNENLIRARGEIIAEIDSPWIQSESAAQAVADWIAAHWSNGADEYQVEVFGNPLFEVGDVVAIEFPAKGMTAATHQFFVTGIETDFESGISTTLTLQRKN